MATIVAVGLLIIAVILFLAVRKRWISGDTLKTLADIAGVLALIAAVAMFIVPSPTLHEPTSESRTPRPESVITYASDLADTPSPSRKPIGTPISSFLVNANVIFDDPFDNPNPSDWMLSGTAQVSDGLLIVEGPGTWNIRHQIKRNSYISDKRGISVLFRHNNDARFVISIYRQGRSDGDLGYRRFGIGYDPSYDWPIGL